MSGSFHKNALKKIRDETNIVQESLNLHEIVDATWRIEQEINTVIILWSFYRKHPISQKSDIISCTIKLLRHIHKSLVQSAFSDEPKLLKHVNLLREKQHLHNTRAGAAVFWRGCRKTSLLVWSANRYRR